MAARPDSGARRPLCGAEFSRLLPPLVRVCVVSFTSASSSPSPSHLPPPPVRGLAALAQALPRDLDPPPLVRGCADSPPPQTRVTRKDASRVNTPLYNDSRPGLVATLKQRDWNICQNAASHGRGDLGPFLAILRLAVRWRADPRDYGS